MNENIQCHSSHIDSTSNPMIIISQIQSLVSTFRIFKYKYSNDLKKNGEFTSSLVELSSSSNVEFFSNDILSLSRT